MTDPNSTDLPASLEIAWGLRSRPGKGPRPSLTLDRIVAGAITVADAEGLAAVSMNRVARELGVATMSLYRYVSAKAELVELMRDAAAGPPPTTVAGESWRDTLTRWCWAELAALRRHRWALEVPISGPPLGPNAVAWMEQGLAALRGCGLSPHEQISTIMLLEGYVRNSAALSASLAAANAESGLTPDEVDNRYWRVLGELTRTGPFPALRELLAMEDFTAYPDEPDPEFAFGISRILDGIEVFIRQRQAATGPV